MDDSNNGSNTGIDGEDSSLPSIERLTQSADTSGAHREHRQESYRSYSHQNRGVCRIEVAKVEWSYLQPWQRTTQMKSVGSGFVIDGQRLLTNAHVVKSAIDIRVRLYGSTRRYAAEVVVYAPDVDLAILSIKGDAEHADFFNSLPTSPSFPDDKRDCDKKGSDGDANKRRRKTLALEFASELPALQESVHVVGFPTGGRTICVTEGVVSRIDLYDKIVAIQVDSAINPGNSGGPAFNSKGEVTGVAFSKRITTKTQKIDNIGYLIPAFVVKAFLGRIRTNDDKFSGKGWTYTLSASIPFRAHTLENSCLRLAHNVPQSVHGILITSVYDESGTSNAKGGSVENQNEDDGINDNGNTNGGTFLQKGDVLTKIDGKDVADDGQVVLRGDELIQHAYLMRRKEVDEPVVFTVFRNGEHITCQPRILRDIPCITPRWDDVDFQPNYVILGAVVLLPCFYALKQYKNCGSRLKADIIDWSKRYPTEWEGKQGLVVMTDIFAHELSFSYHRPWRRVVKYNGIPVQSLEHIQQLWEQSCSVVHKDSGDQVDTGSKQGGQLQGDKLGDNGEGESLISPEPLSFVRLELENDDDIVFEVGAAMKAQAEVMATHKIEKPYQILPPNPKYN